MVARSTDPFVLQTMGDAFIRRPYQPNGVSALGIFQSQPVSTTKVEIEHKNGRLSLVPVSARGGVGVQMSESKSTSRVFKVPHIQVDSTIMAESVQNVRQFGSEQSLKTLLSATTEEQDDMRLYLETTIEHHMLGAIKGQILDADGSSVIYDLYSEFGLTAPTVTAIDLAAQADLCEYFYGQKRSINARMGMNANVRWVCLCGSGYFDDLSKNVEVKESQNNFNGANNERRADQRLGGINFADIQFIEYFGSVGEVDFVADKSAYLFPIVQGMFKTYFAPADYNFTVNKMGQPMYMFARELDSQKGFQLEAQSNPLCINRRPEGVQPLASNS